MGCYCGSAGEKVPEVKSYRFSYTPNLNPCPIYFQSAISRLPTSTPHSDWVAVKEFILNYLNMGIQGLGFGVTIIWGESR